MPSIADVTTGVDDATLDRVFSALSDPIRRGIIARLADGEATVSELAAPYAVSMPAISKHLRVLETAGLITRSRDRQFRRSSLQAQGMRGAFDWLERYRILWDSRIDRLEAHLREQRRDEEAP